MGVPPMGHHCDQFLADRTFFMPNIRSANKNFKRTQAAQIARTKAAKTPHVAAAVAAPKPAKAAKAAK